MYKSVFESTEKAAAALLSLPEELIIGHYGEAFYVYVDGNG